MKKISKIFFNLIFLWIIAFSAEAENKILSKGKGDARSCCKSFFFLDLSRVCKLALKNFLPAEKDFIDEGLVKFEHHPFPLDLAALNAEIILRCHVDNNKRFELLAKFTKNKVYGQLDLI